MQRNLHLIFVVVAFGAIVAMVDGAGTKHVVRPRAEDTIRVYLQNYEENEEGSVGDQLAECTLRRHQFTNLRAALRSTAAAQVLEPMTYPTGPPPRNTAWYDIVGPNPDASKTYFNRQCALWSKH